MTVSASCTSWEPETSSRLGSTDCKLPVISARCQRPMKNLESNPFKPANDSKLSCILTGWRCILAKLVVTCCKEHTSLQPYGLQIVRRNAREQTDIRSSFHYKQCNLKVKTKVKHIKLQLPYDEKLLWTLQRSHPQTTLHNHNHTPYPNIVEV